MARHVAIAVGVSSVEGLSLLTGVPDGVEQFADWAAAQGFEVIRHQDTVEPVAADEVYAAVHAAVEAGDVERLFVFFSGHGLAPGVGDDLWLLSDAAEDPSAAVNVAQSVALARYCGIPHVAFFADACRTPADVRMNGLVGRPIFPQVRYPQVRVQVDQFYATISGDPAYERQPTGGDAAFGIFTRCLLTALRGDADGALTAVGDGRAPYAVLAHPLADYLWQRVRQLSSTEVGVTQTPDCVPGSVWQPNVLAWIPRQHAEPPAPPPPIIVSGGGGGCAMPGEFEARPEASLRALDAASPPAEEGDEDRRALVAELTERIVAQPGRSHFETRIGASVVGAPLARVFLDGGDLGVFEEDSAWQVRGRPDRPTAALLEVALAAGGSGWAATALIPGYVTTVTMGGAGADHVAFIAVDGDMERDRYALAAAGAAARAGRLGFPDEDEPRRLLAEANPTMGVLAGYAFHRAGRAKELEQLVHRFLDREFPVPYDVALVAGLVDDVADRCVPAYPMMTRGWALSDTIPGGEELFRYARRQLQPAPWTTFGELSEDAVARLGAMSIGEALT